MTITLKDRAHVGHDRPDWKSLLITGEAVRAPVLESLLGGKRQCSVEEIDKTLASQSDTALAHLTARRFAEAHAEFAQALRLVLWAREAVPDYRVSLAVVSRLMYPYGALLIRREDFTTAAHYLDQARRYLQYFETQGLLKNRAQLRQYCALTRKRVALESAYLALRQRDYDRASAQVTQLLKNPAGKGEDLLLQRLRASAYLILAKVHYEQRRYGAADMLVRKSMTLYSRHDDGETFGALIRARILLAEGKYSDALTTAISGCQHALERPGIPYTHETSAHAQIEAFLLAVQQAHCDPQLWARMMPDEREELGEFFVVLGTALQQASAQTEHAAHCLLIAGTLLPPAEQIDIPEFARLLRSLGQQARHDPLAFDALAMLTVHPLVLSRWEFVEATVETLGQLPVFPALASIAALKTALPQNLPRDTYGLIDAIHADLETRFGISGRTALCLGMRTMEKLTVRFFLKGAISREIVPRVAELIAATAHDWQLAEVGMADPTPSTPELEALTDLIEEALLPCGLTVEDERNTRR